MCIRDSYSGAQTGANEYVSVLLCDSADNVLYYGNIAGNSADGTASVTIPAVLDPDSYTLKVDVYKRQAIRFRLISGEP